MSKENTTVATDITVKWVCPKCGAEQTCDFMPSDFCDIDVALVQVALCEKCQAEVEIELY